MTEPDFPPARNKDKYRLEAACNQGIYRLARELLYTSLYIEQDGIQDAILVMSCKRPSESDRALFSELLERAGKPWLANSMGRLFLNAVEAENEDTVHALHAATRTLHDRRAVELLPAAAKAIESGNRGFLSTLLDIEGREQNLAKAQDSVLLCIAVKHKQIEMVRLLAEKAGRSGVNARGAAALWLAVHNADAECVKTLLEAGAEPRQAEIGLEALRSGNPVVLELLIKAGATFDHENDITREKMTNFAARGARHCRALMPLLGASVIDEALVPAAAIGNLPAVLDLLELGADPTWDGSAACEIAAKNGHTGAVELLIARGARIEGMDAEQEEGASPSP